MKYFDSFHKKDYFIQIINSEMPELVPEPFQHFHLFILWMAIHIVLCLMNFSFLILKSTCTFVLLMKHHSQRVFITCISEAVLPCLEQNPV